MSQQQKNRVDELATSLAQQGRVQDIETELGKFDRASLTKQEEESWCHLRGIVASRRGDHESAMSRLIEARAEFPESGVIAFSLGQEYEHVGDVAAMFAQFDPFAFPKVPVAYALAQARYAYLWSEFDRGIRYVEPILEAHFRLGVADDTFLYLRRMPFFTQTWNYLAAFSELRRNLEWLEAITQRATERLDSYNPEPQQRFLACMKSGNFSSYTTQPDYGIAMERVRSAVIRSQSEATFDGATKLLDSVVLADNDFPWLRDVLLAARCAAAHRLEPAAEPALVEEFFRRQPLLFEPDHAVYFRLLAYQEHVKTLYQARSRSR